MTLTVTSSDSSVNDNLRLDQIKTSATYVIDRNGVVWKKGGGGPTGDPLRGNYRRISGNFGETRSTGQHAGLDLTAPIGTPIYSTGSGVVSFAGPAGTYGNLVKVTHEDGTETLYAHMNNINVRSGQTVDDATVLGGVGSTGRSTGPHLHYEIRKNGRPVDPRSSLSKGRDTSPQSLSLCLVGGKAQKESAEPKDPKYQSQYKTELDHALYTPQQWNSFRDFISVYFEVFGSGAPVVEGSPKTGLIDLTTTVKPWRSGRG